MFNTTIGTCTDVLVKGFDAYATNGDDNNNCLACIFVLEHWEGYSTCIVNIQPPSEVRAIGN